MVWYVAFGSAVDGAARFLPGTLIQQRVAGTFPMGTLTASVTAPIDVPEHRRP